MKFNLKTYKLSIFRNYLKKKGFLIIAISVTQKNQIKQNQKFKKLNYNYYQVYNTLFKKVLKNSIYKNYLFLIKSVIILLSTKNNKIITELSQLKKQITVIGVKIDNKIYFAHQLNLTNLKLTYKVNHLNTTQTLKTILTSFKISK